VQLKNKVPVTQVSGPMQCMLAVDTQRTDSWSNKLIGVQDQPKQTPSGNTQAAI
jgi:hypothetical protein